MKLLTHPFHLLIALIGLTAWTSPLQAQMAYTAEHMDLGVAWDGNNLYGVWINDFAVVNGVIDSTPVFLANEIKAVGIYDDPAFPLNVPINRPAASTWDFLGVGPGEPLYILPSGGTPNTLPYLGISTEHGSLTPFDNPITISLVDMTGPAGSTFNLHVGSTSVMSATNNSASGSISLIKGAHEHYNWTFTNMGVYHLTFEFSGFIGTTQHTAQDTFRFDIIPEPSGALLVLVGVVLALTGRRRIHRQV